MRSIRYGVIAVGLVIMGLNKILFAPGVRTDGTASFSKAKDMTVSGEPDWMPAGAPVMIGPEGAREIGIVVLPHAKVQEAAKIIAQNAGVPPHQPTHHLDPRCIFGRAD